MSNLFYIIRHLLLFPACHIYLAYSPFVRFINFCYLMNLSSSYQTSVIFSPLVIYSLFTLSSHPINSPTVHITNTTRSSALSCARSLRLYTFLTNQASLAIVPFWLWGGSDRGWGFPYRTNRFVSNARVCCPSVERLLVGHQIGSGLTWSAIRPLFFSLFPEKVANIWCPHGGEHPVARTG